MRNNRTVVAKCINCFYQKEGCLFGMHGGILVKARDFYCNKGEKLQ